MSVLSAAVQKQVEDALLKDGVLTPEKLQKLRADSSAKSQPLFSFLVSQNVLNNETLTKTIAHVTKVPYVNLSAAHIDPKILALLPQDVAERYMAVPLGEMQNRLVVAMLDSRDRFLKPGGVLVPMRESIMAAVVHAPDAYREITGPWDAPDFDGEAGRQRH